MGGDPIPGLHSLTPFIAWGRGEPCPVCGKRPPKEVEKSWHKWSKWSRDHIFKCIRSEG